jgi:hypothetical protein
MNPNQALCEKGDFALIVASMRESGEAIAASPVTSLRVTIAV